MPPLPENLSERAKKPLKQVVLLYLRDFWCFGWAPIGHAAISYQMVLITKFYAQYSFAQVMCITFAKGWQTFTKCG